jgi:HEPN domain-containing protein
LSPEREEAELVLRKAREDQTAVNRFSSDPMLSDAVVGFHAQQAIEKAVKSVLLLKGIAVPRTHDIRFLFELLEASGSQVPEIVRAGEAMTPWAVEFRYGESLGEPLDRASAQRVVSDVMEWAAARFAEFAER